MTLSLVFSKVQGKSELTFTFHCSINKTVFPREQKKKSVKRKKKIMDKTKKKKKRVNTKQIEIHVYIVVYSSVVFLTNKIKHWNREKKKNIQLTNAGRKEMLILNGFEKWCEIERRLNN